MPHGSVAKVRYKSSVIGFDRRCYIYTPAGYEDGSQRYPVFYLLHGAGGDEDAWTNMGRTAQIMDNLIAQGKAKPMIVVMTNGNANQAGAQNEVPSVPAAQAQQGSGMTGKFEEHLVKDVVPFIEKNYRTLTGRDNRAIAGLSMGGGHTQTITNDNPGMFGYIGVFSMGIMGSRQQGADAERIEKERDAKIEKLKTAATSSLDSLWQGRLCLSKCRNPGNTLDKHNFKYVYAKVPVVHMSQWRIYLSDLHQCCLNKQGQRHKVLKSAPGVCALRSGIENITCRSLLRV